MNTSELFQNVGNKDMHYFYVCIANFDFGNNGIQFRQYRVTTSAIPVYNFVNTGEGTFLKIWAGL